MAELRPWQEKIKSLCGQSQNIHVIYDPHGNIGKSYLRRHLVKENLVQRGDYDDIVSIDDSKALFIDDLWGMDPDTSFWNKLQSKSGVILGSHKLPPSGIANLKVYTVNHWTWDLEDYPYN